MKTKFTLSQKLLLVLATLLLFSVQIFCLFTYKNELKTRQMSAARIYGEGISVNVTLSLNEGIVISNYIKNLYIKYHENFIKDFTFICEDFLNTNPLIKTLCIAPNGIVQGLYPIEDAEEGIGMNLLAEDDNSNGYHKAIKAREITVSGPYNLAGGGKGLVIRNPIFENGKFSAFSIVILDWDVFIEKNLTKVASSASGYKVGIWNRQDLQNIINDDGFIYKNSKKEISRLVNVQIRVPHDVWYVSVEPINGWKAFSNMWHEILVTTFFVLMGILGIFLRQVSNSRKLYIAQHDDLTDLLSRSTFLTKTQNLIKNNPNEKICIVAADIENFKVTNSIYGTEKCDEILKYLAKQYLNLSPYGLCTRFGSDHFIFVLRQKSVEQDIEELNLVADVIANDAPVENITVKYGYYGKVDGSTPVNLLCDKALLAAKSILHNYEKTVANYDGPLSTKNEKSQLLESSFLTALKNEDFKIWLQPKFDAITEEVVGAEALIRWIKEDGTVISPADFIHVFEDDGLIYKLDLYVFEKVCKKIKYWLEEGEKIIPISVNISRTSLQHKDIIKEYNCIINEIGISAEYVPLEITESSTAANKKIKNLTEDLKDTGFKIHMDDFGSGLSSLESLNLLPFDVIKLDKSLIDFIGTSIGEELLRHSIEIIQFMHLKVIAEGVETKEQLEFLKKLKCDHIQGFYFSAPMPYEEFIDFLKEKKQSKHQ